MLSKRMSLIKRLKIVNKYPIKPLRLSQQECKALWERDPIDFANNLIKLTYEKKITFQGAP